MSEKKVKMHYGGSVGWLIFWVIVFFPVALVLLATSGRFDLDGQTYHVRYDGSRFWLCFWVIVMFPVAILLMLLNGVALIKERGDRVNAAEAASVNSTTNANNVPIV